jgi:hypothetical protein
VRIREDVRDRIGDPERDLVRLEDVLDLARRPGPAPGRHDAVDLVSVLGPPLCIRESPARKDRTPQMGRTASMSSG